MPALPTLELPLVLLILAATGHTLALWSLQRRALAKQRWLAALAQVSLLGATVLVGLRALEVNAPAAWLPPRTVQITETAIWLALLIFLIAGYWWRSPGLGVTLPALAAALVVMATLIPDLPATRGFALPVPLSAVFAVLHTGTLALAALGLASLLARWLEHRVLGAQLLAHRVATGLFGGAALLWTAQLALAVVAWLGRPDSAPVWTLRQTWLVAIWLLLLLTAYAVRQEQRVAVVLASLTMALMLLNLIVVAGMSVAP